MTHAQSHHLQVESPAQTQDVDGSRGVFAFLVVQVPTEDGYTVEAELCGGGRRCWPRTVDLHSWLLFDSPDKAEAWLHEERESGPDWSRGATATRDVEAQR